MKLHQRQHQRTDATLLNWRKVVYKPARPITRGVHHYVRETEADVLNAQNVVHTALELCDSELMPDIMLGHNGRGEMWYLKDVFPNCR